MSLVDDVAGMFFRDGKSHGSENHDAFRQYISVY